MASHRKMARIGAILRRLICFSALACAAAIADTRADETPIVLENGQVRLEADSAAGRIVRIQDKASGITLAPPAAMADNFRVILEMPDKKTAVILGKDQKLAKVDRTADGISLHWGSPLKDTTGAEHKAAVRMDVKANGNALEFGLHVDNDTPNKIQEATYPIVGGLASFGAPGKPADGVLWIPTSAPMTKKVEFPFETVAVAYPGHATMSFTCIQSAAANKSLYFASHDSIARRKAYFFDPIVSGDAKDVTARIQHTPMTPAGGKFDGSTVVLQVVDGDWHAAGKVYRQWFDRTFGIRKPSQDWIRRQSFFLMTMFGLPEGQINLRFKDIPEWGRAAKEHGINAVQVSGWQVGGHDNGYPYYIPDPRQGTWQELEDGIKACHAMGLKVYFFVNYQPMMLESDWYKSELVNYREFGPDGGLTWNAGWGMGTLSARMGHPKLMTWADLGFPQFRKIIVDQFEHLAKIGGDGVHVDKMFPTAMGYNPNSPMSPDTSTWEGAILLSKEVNEACLKHNPNWCMSFECNWDRMLQFGGATWWVGNQRITRSVFPENAETLAITLAYDYLGINNAVREGHIVMLAPKTFTRGVDWKPFEGLADYIKEVKRIQDSLADTVFLGEVLGPSGVLTPPETATGTACNAFRNSATGKRACIVTNASMTPKKQTIVGFEGNVNGQVRVHALFQPAKVVKLPAEIDVPAEQIVFVEEL